LHRHYYFVVKKWKKNSHEVSIKRFHQVVVWCGVHLLAPSGIGKTRLRFSFFSYYCSIYLFI